ncbi:hypothetical protein D3C76_264940 [compost metagenome]
MDDSKINQKHINDIGADGSKPQNPGMQKAAPDTLVQLCGVDRANRSRKRQPQKDIAYEYMNSARPPFTIL